MKAARALISIALLLTVLIPANSVVISQASLNPPNLSQCESVRIYSVGSNSFGTGSPYGDATVLVTICKIAESIPDYDWYFYDVRFNTVPGASIYNSMWETAHEYAYHKVWSPGPHRFLWAHSPGTTSASSGQTQTVTISVSIGSIGFSYSTSYTISWLDIIDKTNYNTNEANWEADFNEKNDPQKTGPSVVSTTLEYSFIVVTGPMFCSFVDGKYGVMWGYLNWLWWNYKTFWTNTIYLDLCPYTA